MPNFKHEQFYKSIPGDEIDTSITREKAQEFFDKNYGLLNNKEGDIILLDAPGGTRKTPLLNVLALRIRMQDVKVAATATSRITATHLHEGRTGHSMFRLTVKNIHSKSFCNISAESQLAQFLKDMDIAVINEGPMWNKLDLGCLV